MRRNAKVQNFAGGLCTLKISRKLTYVHEEMQKLCRPHSETMHGAADFLLGGVTSVSSLAVVVGVVVVAIVIVVLVVDVVVVVVIAVIVFV